MGKQPKKPNDPAENYRNGMAKFLGVSPKAINPEPVKNYAEAMKKRKGKNK